MPLGVYDTWDEADAVLSAARTELEPDAQHDGVTLATWAERVLDRRERDGIRGIKAERNRWKIHVADTEIATFALKTITRGDVQRWLDRTLGKRAKDKRGARPPKAVVSFAASCPMNTSLALVRIWTA